MMKKVCLVSTGIASTNPRLVKECEALAKNGYDVYCIVGVNSHYEGLAGGILEDAGAKCVISCRSPRYAHLARRLLQEFCLSTSFASPFLPAWWLRTANSSQTTSLTSASIRTIANLYIGHTVAALPAVVNAAKHNKGKAGFDAEDYHSEELGPENNGYIRNRVAKKIEDLYLPHVEHFTAASPMIAEEYNKRFGRLPISILNVFPKREATLEHSIHAFKSSEPSFYWFSQTIGPGRGLESILAIAKAINVPLRLDFRGRCNSQFEKKLFQIVEGSKVRLNILNADRPEKMVSLAKGYTAGLALELSQPFNRDVCLTNKIFTYLLAGTPVVLTNTSAQEKLSTELGASALLIDLSDIEGSATKIKQWLSSGGCQLAAGLACKLGQEKYNWDVESEKLVNAVDRLLRH